MTIRFNPGDLVRARGREWIALPSASEDLLVLRPLSGSEMEIVHLAPALEALPVEPAHFDLPSEGPLALQAIAALLSDALRLSLRRGAGPFRSAAHLTFEPRAYQLVPLLMALRQPVPRLLIADDVGIGKTIEAGLILREWIDRGEIDRFAVLCPPHLVEQWTEELKERFGIDTVAVTASSAKRLERGLAASQTLFDANPHTVVSLDYIKAERRRDAFARACPNFVIVDEAHACVGTKQGSKQQRYDLLSDLAADKERALIMLTATPHSGDEEAFARLLALIDPSFASMQFEDQAYRQRLARHFVQRRRRDLEEGGWDDERVFPKHNTREFPYDLDSASRDFHESVIDYCLGVVEKAGEGRRERRLALWGTLALMRCVGSSPAAAASALRTRASNEAERIEAQVYDEDGDDEDAVDLEPALPAGETVASFETEGDPALKGLIETAERLRKARDPKLEALVDLLKPLINKGAKPVVFCRYIATADHVAAHLRKVFPKHDVQAVTGQLTSEERRDRVEAMGETEQRLLVATDCLSEGINLQQVFDAVIHYDLSWNPTRHQQREGRVNRYGQSAPEVYSAMMYATDSAIDGAVLEVVIRKAEAIRKATGVTVPLPDEHGPVTDALMSAMIRLRGRKDPRQMTLDLVSDEGEKLMESRWRDAEENERKSRARFAQNAMKPEEVRPEWDRASTLLGNAADAQTFVAAAMKRFDAPLEARPKYTAAHVADLARPLRERLFEKGLQDEERLSLSEPASAGTAFLSRAHPLTATLAEALLEGALDPQSMPDLGIGRRGAWPTRAVDKRTLVALLRLRFQLTVHGKTQHLLLAEEASLVAIADGAIVATGLEARALLAAEATRDLADIARERMVERAATELPALMEGVIAAHVRDRAAALAEDHGRVRQATAGLAGTPSRVTVEPVLPPDVIGLFTLIPEQN
ncbi:DEAD/DEAH box helicase [Jiella avicenniae]|uniref:DEAD/DEAH box helicase n=1 Tax=Jiella avicenniae TaxID=2907202 RepID=A0A9X1T4S6_9HYPH|nr:DEAD/DEAH box helicase [Jiella avicenniae]MCE7028104.1 DEAD/DEAH box helicase [Jiella avicenniae]